MSYLAEKIAELESYLPPLTRRADFDAFWARTRAQALSVPLRPELRRVEDYPARAVTVYDISYCGFDETRIHGWLLLPAFAGPGPYPCMVQYHGFGGSRGVPSDHLAFAALGCAVLAVDCREQGGITGNCAHYSGSGLFANVGSKGVRNKDEYYYRAVYMDCVKALDFLETLPEIDADRLFVRGTSQGGALGMAVSGLDARPKLALVNVPSNSNIEYRIEHRHGSFAAVNDYLRAYPDELERVYETLSYFDTMNLADRIQARVFASVALADPVCPAKCYYATYNRIRSDKQITVYPFNEHDGARATHVERELRYLRSSGLLD